MIRAVWTHEIQRCVLIGTRADCTGEQFAEALQYRGAEQTQRRARPAFDGGSQLRRIVFADAKWLRGKVTVRDRYDAEQ